MDKIRQHRYQMTWENVALITEGSSFFFFVDVFVTHLNCPTKGDERGEFNNNSKKKKNCTLRLAF